MVSGIEGGDGGDEAQSGSVRAIGGGLSSAGVTGDEMQGVAPLSGGASTVVRRAGSTDVERVVEEFNQAINSRDLIRLSELMTDDHRLITGTAVRYRCRCFGGN